MPMMRDTYLIAYALLDRPECCNLINATEGFNQCPGGHAKRSKEDHDACCHQDAAPIAATAVAMPSPAW